MKKALIVWGGWDGHEPKEIGQTFDKALTGLGFEVESVNSLDVFADADKLMGLDLIVPVWTAGTIAREQVMAVSKAVQSGVGMAGCHGGMCDAFRASTDWQFITGGQWVAHPGNDGVEYVVNIKKDSHPIVAGIDDFTVKSEQYYLHVDPAVQVLATTRFPVADGPHAPNGTVDMPVVWLKRWGKGRVFYCSLGHHNDIIVAEPTLTIMKRGFVWAAEGKEAN